MFCFYPSSRLTEINISQRVDCIIVFVLRVHSVADLLIASTTCKAEGAKINDSPQRRSRKELLIGTDPERGLDVWDCRQGSFKEVMGLGRPCKPFFDSRCG